MHSNVFTSRGCTLAIILTLMVSLTSVAAPSEHVRAGQDYVIYLPLAMNGAGDTQLPPPVGSPEQIVLDRINFYRTLASAPQLQLHPALLQAAQHHADYYLLNYADADAMVNGPHGEVAGKPGYTGRVSWDRASAAGYPWYAGWEVMHFEDDPVRSVDGWAATVFHRVVILDPYLEYIGYGHGLSGTARVDVADFSHATADPARQQLALFPAPGQTNVPLLGMWESPSPLPPGETDPFGYPITLQPPYGVPLAVSQAELWDSTGAPVAIYPNPPECGTTCYALIATTPLQSATTYTAHVRGTIDGVPFDLTWSFTTRS
jgi:Cysteine-rich secretory protein family